MQPDQSRKPGFYWVRFEGEVQVAEWSSIGSWLVAGSDKFYYDEEVCELLSDRLELKDAARTKLKT